MPIFRIKCVKIYTCQKKFTRIYSWRSWQISGMAAGTDGMDKFHLWSVDVSSSIFIAHFSQTLNKQTLNAIFSCLTILSLFPLLQIMHVVILITKCHIKVLAGGQIAIFPGRQVHWLTNNSNKRDRSSNPIWPMMWHRGQQKSRLLGPVKF